MEDKLNAFRKLRESYKRTGKIEECFCHKKHECKPPIKQSHSIQRNGRLSIIEGDVNGNRSVYTFTSFSSSENKFMEDLKPIGKKEASTFFGFCEYHDTVIFSEIENKEFDGSERHMFLHSYRSFAHSYHKKNEEYKAYHDDNSDFVKAIPRDELYLKRKGVTMGLADAKESKRYIDDCFDRNAYDELQYLIHEVPGLYPFAVSSIMSPKVSYYNKPMANHTDPDKPFPQLMITFLPDKTKTFVILAAFPDDEQAVELLDELGQLPELKLENAITSLIISNCENTFFSPLVWNSLNKNEKRALLDEFEMNSHTIKYYKKFFKSKFNFFDSRFEMKRLTKGK